MKKEEFGSNYLTRWTLFECRWFSIYLHRFVGGDWSRDLHDHPKRFVSIGLLGGYSEQTAKQAKKISGMRFIFRDEIERHIHRAPWLRTFGPDHVHTITGTFGQPCWTLVIVGRHQGAWGFYVPNNELYGACYWVPWEQYEQEKKKAGLL